ncbi:hypothetical protein [uncultured Jatrophihabitans sp.]|uniref:hypothetical protein n=1 Tax=uncultured Jatrophihabitans sp. TaxID=1610747 RepID=UPI0035CA8B7F
MSHVPSEADAGADIARAAGNAPLTPAQVIAIALGTAEPVEPTPPRAVDNPADIDPHT